MGWSAWEAHVEAWTSSKPQNWQPTQYLGHLSNPWHGPSKNLIYLIPCQGRRAFLHGQFKKKMNFGSACPSIFFLVVQQHKLASKLGGLCEQGLLPLLIKHLGAQHFITEMQAVHGSLHGHHLWTGLSWSPCLQKVLKKGTKALIWAALAFRCGGLWSNLFNFKLLSLSLTPFSW